MNNAQVDLDGGHTAVDHMHPIFTIIVLLDLTKFPGCFTDLWFIDTCLLNTRFMVSVGPIFE